MGTRSLVPGLRGQRAALLQVTEPGTHRARAPSGSWFTPGLAEGPAARPGPEHSPVAAPGPTHTLPGRRQTAEKPGHFGIRVPASHLLPRSRYWI